MDESKHAIAAALQKLGPPWPELVLDHFSSEPYYAQLVKQINAWIASGQFTDGRHLPSERDLAIALRLSRTTIKRCYDVLRQTNALGSKGRSGTKITAPKRVQPTLGKLKGFAQEMQELGMTASTTLVSKEITLDRMMASLFGRPSTAQFLRLVRVRSGDGTPMTREIAWYDLTLAPALAQWDAQGSAYAFLNNQCGVVLGQADQTVEAVLSSDEEQQAFGFSEPAPCLLFKRKTYSVQEQLVEYVEGTFRGDVYVYRLRLEGGSQ